MAEKAKRIDSIHMRRYSSTHSMEEKLDFFLTPSLSGGTLEGPLLKNNPIHCNEKKQNQEEHD